MISLINNLKHAGRRSKQVQLNLITIDANEDDKAVPWLRSLVAGLSQRRPEISPGSIHVGFVVDKVALG
jgi:predicted secreted protein